MLQVTQLAQKNKELEESNELLRQNHRSEQTLLQSLKSTQYNSAHAQADIRMTEKWPEYIKVQRFIEQFITDPKISSLLKQAVEELGRGFIFFSFPV